MKDQAIVCNIGHFDNEIEVGRLKSLARHPQAINIKPQVDKWIFPDGHAIYVLAEGRLVNLGCATGTPALSCRTRSPTRRWRRSTWREPHEVGVYTLPKVLDEEVARLHLEHVGAKLTKLSRRQAEYLGVPCLPWQTAL
jgi:adenosylhomocysteinase